MASLKVLIAALGLDHAGLVFVIVESENFQTEFNARATADTFIPGRGVYAAADGLVKKQHPRNGPAPKSTLPTQNIAFVTFYENDNRILLSL
jgi:hypothetical protein